MTAPKVRVHISLPILWDLFGENFTVPVVKIWFIPYDSNIVFESNDKLSWFYRDLAKHILSMHSYFHTIHLRYTAELYKTNVSLQYLSFHILTPSIISPYGGRVLLCIDWSEYQWHHQSRAPDWVSRTFYRTKTIAMMVKEML